MKKKDAKIEPYKRDSLFARLDQWDVFAKEYDYIEVTEWHNGEGFDVDISAAPGCRFQITYGQWDALKQLVKQITKREYEKN